MVSLKRTLSATAITALSALALLGALHFASTSAASAPVNLLVNPGFESWSGSTPAMWTKNGTQTTFSKSTEHHTGSYSLKIATTSKLYPITGVIDGAVPTVSSTVIGTTYTASCWVKSTKLITVKLQLQELTANGSSANTASTTSLNVPDTTTWHQIKLGYTAIAGGHKLPLTLYSTNIISGNGSYELDDCSLTAADTTPPTAPTNLQLKALAPSQVNLSWTPSTDNVGVTGYRVLRNNLQIATTAKSITAYADTGVTPGTSYSYTVTAYDAAGNISVPAATLMVSTPFIPPAAPTNLTAIASPTQVALSWTASSPGSGTVTGYQISRNGSLMATVPTLSYTDTTVTPSASFTYVVSAIDSNTLLSGPSNAVSIVTPALAPPTAPTSLTATAMSPTQIDLSWIASSPGTGTITGYQIARDATLMTTITGTTYSDTTVSPNTGYVYTVTAIDSNALTSTASAPAAITSPALMPPTAPTNLSATTIGPTQVNLSWTPSTPGTGQITGYQIFRDGAVIATIAGTNYSDTQASPNTSPMYTVMAVDSNGLSSAPSAAASATTPALIPPTAPANLTATTTSPTQINLAWAASAPGSGAITGYQIIRNGALLVTVTGTNYSDTTLNPGGSYTYSVAAVDTYASVSPASNPAADATPPDYNTPYSLADWNTALSTVINSDVTQSVTLPNGNILWTFGDTTQVNGKSTVGGYGYPHDAFVTQAPGTLNFTAVPGTYGYGWQQVPNWSDHTFFWMGTPVVDNGVLYVIGLRIQAQGSSFSVLGNYIASFDAQTLAFQSINPLPGGATGTTNWSGITKTADGWWVMGTHHVPCSYVTNCAVGDAAFVAFGSLGTGSSWQIYDNVADASLNIGDSLAPIQISPTQWVAYTKRGGPYGSTQLEELTASSILGPWTVASKWDAPSPPQSFTYGTSTHPEQSSPPGQFLVSYDANGGGPGQYHAIFEYVTY